MTPPRILSALWIVFAGLASLRGAPERIGKIEFFGSKGIDVAAILRALPVREGGPLPKSKKQIREAVERATGVHLTDVAVVCCDENRQWMIYVGLPGESSRPLAYNSPPKGRIRLPGKATKLYEQTMNAMMKALVKGDIGEEGSPGYALATNVALREKQMEIRKYALAHESLLDQVLESSDDAFHREVAAHFLGYAQQSAAQITSLVRASSDPSASVRNNAVRALGELADSGPAAAMQIDPAPFIGMLSSTIWTDRNKGTFVIERLTLHPAPGLMTQLRGDPVDALLEMARWRWRGHSAEALSILGRMAGIEEGRLQSLIEKGDIGEILSSFSTLSAK